MKIRLRSGDASTLQDSDWLQTDGWLAALRDDGRAGPAGDGHARSAPGGDVPPEGPAGAAVRAQAAVRAASTVRAVIGDELRMPVMWCEMGSCISWHADPAALGEADNRARAINAGWRVDALGRLACPRCQQTDAGFSGHCPGRAVGPVHGHRQGRRRASRRRCRRRGKQA